MAATKFEVTDYLQKWNRTVELKKHFLGCCLFNASSLNNKTTFIRDYVIENDIDKLFITESWLCTSESANDDTYRALTPETHSILHVPRSHGRGWGLAVLYRTGLTIIQQSTQIFIILSICVSF